MHRVLSACTASLLVCSLAAAERLEPQAAAEALAATPVTAEPERLYQAFSDFCATHFGAEREALVYAFSGDELALLAGGDWTHASERSLAIGFETNLPATSVITIDGTAVSEQAERHHYLHLHRLSGLDPDKDYRYRIEITDERGNTVRSEVRSLRTRSAGSSIAIPGELGEAPYVLDQPGASYLLTGDLDVPGVAFEVLADDVTLDLGGHTVRFGIGATSDLPGGIVVGGTGTNRQSDRNSGFKLYNGRLVQGDGPALAANTSNAKFAPLAIAGGDYDIAGLSIDYHGPQTWGMRLTKAFGTIDIHHLVMTDSGGRITNRHGLGVRSIGITDSERTENAFDMHHILVRRTRQNGIGGAASIRNNEIYLDSCSTNSFAIQPLSVPGVRAGEMQHNRVFGTGFNAYGFGWAHKDLTIHHNLVHFHGLMLNHRWEGVEDWGDMSTLEAMRVTNYGKGGQVRTNLVYHDNLIVLRGEGGCELRGTGFFSDTSIEGLVFRDNVVKVISEDAQTTQVACIAAHGHTGKPDSLPVVYRDNTLIANLCHVRFGDSYGKGHNHHLIGNRLVREGERADYHTVALGGAYTTAGHRFVDTELGAGTSLEDVYWQRTGKNSGYDVAWTVELAAQSGAQVTIRAVDGGTAFQGTVPADGVLRVPLIQHRVHPPTWPNKGEARDIVGVKLEPLSPYEVTVTVGGEATTRSLAVEGPTRIEF